MLIQNFEVEPVKKIKVKYKTGEVCDFVCLPPLENSSIERSI